MDRVWHCNCRVFCVYRVVFEIGGFMPCFYTGSAEGDAQLAAQEAREELTEVTRVACELAKLATPKKFVKLSEKTQDWVLEHRKTDKKNKTLKKKKSR